MQGYLSQRELDAGLKLLHEKFNDWEKGKIDCFELNEYIHKFHNSVSREIWKKYNQPKTGNWGHTTLFDNTIFKSIICHIQYCIWKMERGGKTVKKKKQPLRIQIRRV